MAIYKTKIYSEERNDPFIPNKKITIWKAEIEEDFGTWKVTRDLISFSEAEALQKLKELKQKYA